MPREASEKDVSLHTIVSGEENQETIILLHGGPAVPEDMLPVMDFLSQKYRVIYFHQRGTGNSPCPSGDFSMEAYIGDIDAVAEHFDLNRFHLFGHSWGGLYAGIYADRRPEKLLSLFLCSPASGTGKQWIKMSWEVSRWNKGRSSLWEWWSMLHHSFKGLIGFDRGHQKFFRQFAINANKGYEVEKTAPLLLHLIKARAVNRTNQGILKYPELKPLPVAHFDITVTYGDDDIYGESITFVKDRYPTAQIATIRDCSHMHWLHNPEIFFKVLAIHFDLPEENN